MNILVIGSGGREHALCWAIAKSSKVHEVFAAPGNGGIEDCATCISLDTGTHEAVISFCDENNISLVVIGPEAPLVDGLADSLNAANIPVFGPSAAAARLEGSKGFTKDLCDTYNIPTAAYGRFNNAEEAKAYAAQKGAPIVIKADGLAAGKGVIIAMTDTEAAEAIDQMFEGAFGDAGAEVVVEEFMEGEEASFFALSDGTNVVALATAQDHKRAFDGDKGPNTGGMGAYSPAPVMTDEMCRRTMDEIIKPTVAAMAHEGCPYKGVLFAGLMITSDGPKLIEYNARFGDPECQVLMMRLDSDMVDGLLSTVQEGLDHYEPVWKPDAALTLVFAAKGYPAAYEKGTVIHGLDAAAEDENVEIFHAGTIREDGVIKAVGGRVLNITARGATVGEAQRRAYAAIKKIDWPQGFYRTDIGWRAIEREKANPS